MTKRAAKSARPFSWTPKRERFCEEYLVDLNQTAAAERAGFSARSAKEQGHQLMQLPEISARIAELQAKRAERVQLDADTVLQELRTLITSDVRNFRVDEHGELVLRDGAPDHAWRAVSSVKHRRIVLRHGDDETETTYEIEYRLWDKNPAIQNAMKHLGMLRDKLEVTGKDGGPVQLHATVTRRIVRPDAPPAEPQSEPQSEPVS